jgi:hypothetical protein
MPGCVSMSTTPMCSGRRAEGYRSRASYKLMEMDDKDHLIRCGDVIVDLGAAPGGWSQVAARGCRAGVASSPSICWRWCLCAASPFCKATSASRKYSIAWKIARRRESRACSFRHVAQYIGVSRSATRPGACTWPNWPGICPQLAETRRRFSGQSFSGSRLHDFLLEMRKTFKWCPHASRMPRVIAARKSICWAGP